MKTIKNYKITRKGFYFTYSDRQHPMFKDQTEKIASLYREIDDQLITELNTEEDKVRGLDKFTHEEVIGWFDSFITPESNTLSGVQLIAAERNRQITDEKWSKEHDALHTNGELADAATTYAMTENQIEYMNENWGNDMYLTMWPFDLKFLKFSPEDRIKQLVKSGALIAAEIDRLQAINEK